MTSSILVAAASTTLVIFSLLVIIRFFERAPNRKARREALKRFEALMENIYGCGTMAEIYSMQDEVFDYTNEWKRVIDLETLTQFTNALHAAISTKEKSLQAERNNRYNRALYN